MDGNTNRAEAERLLGVAEKLLQSRDFNAARDFAILSQENDPLLEGSDQILAVADVLVAAEKPFITTTAAAAASSERRDWYSILQVPRRSDDGDLIKKQYRKLALLLHPDKNRFPLSDQAFKLVGDAWAVLSDPQRKSLFDNELRPLSSPGPASASAPTPAAAGGSSSKLPVRRSERPVAVAVAVQKKNESVGSTRTSVFWTMCPYCYLIYEYPLVYKDCCLRCQSCQRAFHAALMPNLPPLVPGKDAYYCSWGFFPLGFVFTGGVPHKDGLAGSSFPTWMPPMFGAGHQHHLPGAGGDKSNGGNGSGGVARATFPARVGVEFGGNGVGNMTHGNATPAGVPQKRGRGRPKKNPL